ncbi:transient receptor potential cation channel subfamily M member 1-like [Amphiura filiformis]|uniref:transient receptor potential cation channel subfamily M member 1-like n=1 Tax=Amphiura filiformis TaxID=82378 RepID=UPI003B21B7B5
MSQRMCRIAERSYNTDAVNELTNQSSRYEQLAIDLLDKCHEEDTAYTRHLLRAELNKWNQHTCVTLAAGFGLTRFIAHPALQVLLNDHWYGRLNKVAHPKRLQQQMMSELEEKEKISSTRSLDRMEGYDPEDMIEMATSGIRQEHQILLHQFLMTGEEGTEMVEAALGLNEEDADDYESGSEAGVLDSQMQQRPPLWELEFYQAPESRFEKLSDYLQAPVVKFWVDTVFYVIFLALFTYTVLNSRSKMTIPEWIVALFMLSFALEEIRQVLSPAIFARHNLPLSTKINIWALDFWNLVDLTGLILFFTGFGIRLAMEFDDGFADDDGIYVSARIFYCLAIMVWYVRLLDIFSVSESMGPYVNMIFKMGKDALSFGMIALVFMVSYGIVRGALLHPADQLFNVLAIPYWQFYGELFLEDDGRMNCGDTGECPKELTLFT